MSELEVLAALIIATTGWLIVKKVSDLAKANRRFNAERKARRQAIDPEVRREWAGWHGQQEKSRRERKNLEDVL